MSLYQTVYVVRVWNTIEYPLRDKYKKYGGASEVEETVQDLDVKWHYSSAK
jgi:hypothetical protein